LQSESVPETLDVARVVEEEEVAGLAEGDVDAETLLERLQLGERAERDADVRW
jgi:hypothetical protein